MIKKTVIVLVFVLVIIGVLTYWYQPLEEKNLYFGISQEHVRHRGWVVEVDLNSDRPEATVHDMLDVVNRVRSIDIDYSASELYVSGEGGIDVIDLENLSKIRSLPVPDVPMVFIRLSNQKSAILVNNLSSSEFYDGISTEDFMWIINSRTWEKIGGTGPRENGMPKDIRSHEFFSGPEGNEVTQIRGDYLRKYTFDSDSFTHRVRLDSPDDVKKAGGLYPTGKEPNYPYTYLDRQVIKFLDRDTGEVMKSIDLQEEIDGFETTWYEWGNSVTVDESRMKGFIGIISEEGNILELNMETLEISNIYDVDFDLPKYTAISTHMVVGPSSGAPKGCWDRLLEFVRVAQ